MASFLRPSLNWGSSYSSVITKRMVTVRLSLPET